MEIKMKKLHQLLFVAATLSVGSNIQAQQVVAPVAQSQSFGYIGLGVDKVPDSLKAHYPEGVATTQGLLVTRFADESPAADDGIKVYDILIAYDGQPIEAPEAFIEKVRKDTPKRVANFKLIRQGEIQTVAVTIGEQKVAPKKAVPKPTSITPPAAQVPQQMQQQMPQRAAGQYQQSQYPSAVPAGMSANTPPPANYNGLAIRKIGEGVYEASIAFVGANGTPQRRSYKGSHMQILKQVYEAKDLSPAAKQQLLFALRPPKNKTQGMKGMKMPFGNGNMPNPTNMFKGWGW